MTGVMRVDGKPIETGRYCFTVPRVKLLVALFATGSKQSKSRTWSKQIVMMDGRGVSEKYHESEISGRLKLAALTRG